MCCFYRNLCPQRANALFSPYRVTPVRPTPIVNAVYAAATVGTVNDASVIPISLRASTPTNTLSVTDNAVNLSTGTYLLSYGATGTFCENAEAANADDSSSNLSVQLYAGGSPIPGETIASGGNESSVANVSKTILYTATTPTSLSLFNVSGDSVSILDGYITAEKIA